MGSCLFSVRMARTVMERSYVMKRMQELTEPIDRQIMMCDSHEDLLMMASVMLSRVREIMDNQIGVEGRKEIFRDLV
jgi:hypothetical protein